MLRIIDQKTGKAIPLKDQEKLCASDKSQNVGRNYTPSDGRVNRNAAPIVMGGLTQPKPLLRSVEKKK